MVGLSKTAVPGAGLLSTPLIATIVEGRLIAGASLPILLVADVFAVGWYRHHTAGICCARSPCGWASGSRSASLSTSRWANSLRVIDVAIGVIVLVMVAIQLYRMWRRRPPKPATPRDAVITARPAGSRRSCRTAPAR